jgi:hypothetical protein
MKAKAVRSVPITDFTSADGRHLTSEFTLSRRSVQAEI